MKDRVDRQQVADNFNKIRQTETGDVLVQLQKGSNAKDITDTIAAVIGTEATVLKLAQQVALDVRDIDLNTTEVKEQKALAELAGVPVEALKVKAMHPAYGGTQMAIVTMPRGNALNIIRSRKANIGWLIARVREKVTVLRCFRCLAFGHLSQKCSSGNNSTKPFFLCGATEHLAANCKNEPKCTQCESIGAGHKHRSESAKPSPDEGEGKSTEKRKWLTRGTPGMQPCRSWIILLLQEKLPFSK